MAGATNEATENVKEPLQRGQTAPTDENQRLSNYRKVTLVVRQPLLNSMCINARFICRLTNRQLKGDGRLDSLLCLAHRVAGKPYAKLFEYLVVNLSEHYSRMYLTSVKFREHFKRTTAVLVILAQH